MSKSCLFVSSVCILLVFASSVSAALVSVNYESPASDFTTEALPAWNTFDLIGSLPNYSFSNGVRAICNGSTAPGAGC